MVSISIKNFLSFAKNSFIVITKQHPVVSSSLLKDYTPRSFFVNIKSQHQKVIQDPKEAEKAITDKVIQKVNNEIATESHGRLFAVVQVLGKQFKVTNDDLIVLEGDWPPAPGDKIRLEKVLLVGSSHFTLIGRPILPLNQVAVYATVIEKTLSHTKTRFLFVKRKDVRRFRFLKFEQTFLRINSINLIGKVNELGDIDGEKDKIF